MLGNCYSPSRFPFVSISLFLNYRTWLRRNSPFFDFSSTWKHHGSHCSCIYTVQLLWYSVCGLHSQIHVPPISFSLYLSDGEGDWGKQKEWGARKSESTGKCSYSYFYSHSKMYQTSPTRRSWGNLTHLLQLLAHLIRLRHQRHQLDVIVERRQDAGVSSALPAARSAFPKRCARGQREGVNRLPPDPWVALEGCSSTAKIRFNASGPCRSPALSWVGSTQPALIPWGEGSTGRTAAETHALLTAAYFAFLSKLDWQIDWIRKWM